MIDGCRTVWIACCGPAFIAVAASGACAFAAERGVDSDRCKDAIGAIVRKTGAIVDRASPSGNNMFLRHPSAKNLVLMCAPYQASLQVSIDYPGAYPTASFYDLVGGCGAVLSGDSSAVVAKAAVRCQGAALKSADESATVGTSKATLECNAFTRDDGGTLIQVGPRQPD